MSDYLTLIARAELLDALQEAVSASEQRLDLEPQRDFTEAEGLAFDFETVRSMVVWIHDNPDWLILAEYVIKAAVKYFSKNPKKEPEVRIVIRPPFGSDFDIVVRENDAAEEIARRMSASTSPQRSATAGAERGEDMPQRGQAALLDEEKNAERQGGEHTAVPSETPIGSPK